MPELESISQKPSDLLDLKRTQKYLNDLKVSYMRNTTTNDQIQNIQKMTKETLNAVQTYAKNNL